MSYRDVIYLILILKRFYYDLLKFNFTLGLIYLTLQIRKVVHFFLHTLYLHFQSPCGPLGDAILDCKMCDQTSILLNNCQIFQHQVYVPCPYACPLIYRPVCGENGITYHNKCFLDGAKQQKEEGAVRFYT